MLFCKCMAATAGGWFEVCEPMHSGTMWWMMCNYTFKSMHIQENNFWIAVHCCDTIHEWVNSRRYSCGSWARAGVCNNLHLVPLFSQKQIYCCHQWKHQQVATSSSFPQFKFVVMECARRRSFVQPVQQTVANARWPRLWNRPLACHWVRSVSASYWLLW